MMRKILRYLLWSIGVIILLPFLIVFLLYLPFVQNYIKDKAVGYVADNYGMVVSVGQFRLGYPLNLTLQDVYVGETPTDTLAAVGNLHLEVGVEDILQQCLSVRELRLCHVNFGMSDDTTGMNLKVLTDTLSLKARKIDLKNRWVNVDAIRLAGGDVSMDVGVSKETDTTQSTPMDWLISVEQLVLDRISYRMSMESIPSLDAGLAQGKVSGFDLALGTQIVDVDSLAVSGAWCRLVTASGDTLQEPETVTNDSIISVPWTVRVNCVNMDNSVFNMSEQGASKAMIALYGIGFRVEDVFNQGTRIRAKLKDVWASQQDGVTLTSLQGDVRLDTVLTSLQGGYICTSNSKIKIEAGADADFQNLPGQSPLSLIVSGYIGMSDIVYFYPELPQELWNRQMRINTSLSLTDKIVFNWGS